MGLRGLWFRNGLVVFQFTVAVILIVGTLTIYSQLRFMQNGKLGYNREQVALIPNMGSFGCMRGLLRSSAEDAGSCFGDDGGRSSDEH